MPNRLIRAGFLDSEKINNISTDAQLFFIRLMLVVDDYGCFDARPEMLKSNCYPVSNMKIQAVKSMLSECCKCGLVQLYSVSGKNYLSIPNFSQRLRAKRRKYPEPPDLQNVSDTCPSHDGHMTARSEVEVEVEVEVEENKNIVPKRHRVQFAKPSIEEVSAYISEMKYTDFTAEQWIDHYASNGWKVGKNQMKDWQASVRTWGRNNNTTKRAKYDFEQNAPDKYKDL